MTGQDQTGLDRTGTGPDWTRQDRTGWSRFMVFDFIYERSTLCVVMIGVILLLLIKRATTRMVKQQTNVQQCQKHSQKH